MMVVYDTHAIEKKMSDKIGYEKGSIIGNTRIL